MMHVSIEGNIASGKSTLVNKLNSLFIEKSLSFKVYPEPINEWQNFGPRNINVLNQMYHQPTRFSYLFQNLALTSKVNQLFPSIKIRDNIIAERSIMSQLKVFVPLLHDKGMITDEENEMIKYQMESVHDHLQMTPDMYIYLRVSPITCMSRLLIRGRPEENKVNMEYLNQLHRYHENWMSEEKVKTVIIDQTEMETLDLNKIIREILNTAYLKGKFEEIFPSYNEIKHTLDPRTLALYEGLFVGGVPYPENV
jgi:deoxyadenosine/deoxycytidine kinase